MRMSSPKSLAMLSALTQSNRPIRLRLLSDNASLEDILLVKQVNGHETLCGGCNIGCCASLRMRDLAPYNRTQPIA